MEARRDDPVVRLTPASCGVVGGGRMGAGIVHALLLSGAQVVLVERSEEEAAAARERVLRAVNTSVTRGQVTDAAPVLARLTVATDAAALKDTALVIEAVPEDLDLKIETFRRIGDAVASDTVIASNTSSLSLDLLADAVPHPERVIGLHFFNPVPASKLVEVVLGDRTAAELLELREVRVEHVGQRYFGWVNIRACDFSQTVHDDRDRELGVLCSVKPGNANEPELDDQVIGPLRKLHADGFVHDPAITRKELYGLAKILRRGGDIEQQPRPPGICLGGKMKSERSIVERVCGKFKEPSLGSGGDAVLAFLQILLKQADMPQQGRRINVVFSKRSNRPPRGESGRRRQQALSPTRGHLHNAPFSKLDLA